MNNTQRKQFILPQGTLTQVKKILGTKTETEAVILSLQSVIRQKKLAEFSKLPQQIRYKSTLRNLHRMRRD